MQVLQTGNVVLHFLYDVINLPFWNRGHWFCVWERWQVAPICGRRRNQNVNKSLLKLSKPLGWDVLQASRVGYCNLTTKSFCWEIGWQSSSSSWISQQMKHVITFSRQTETPLFSCKGFPIWLYYKRRKNRQVGFSQAAHIDVVG